MDDERFTYCFKGDHHPRKERMLGDTCIECRAKQTEEDALSLAVIAAAAVFQKKLRKDMKKG